MVEPPFDARRSGSLTPWFVRCVNPDGVDGDDGELVDYHELDDFEAAPIERSKALASIASPKVDVSLVDREELDERRERGEAVTDGGVEQDVDRTDRVEPFSGEPADTPERKTRFRRRKTGRSTRFRISQSTTGFA